MFTVELVRRWYDFWRERPGTGRRVNSGGAKIIFSDTQTHGRSAENFRLSGVVDPMRIPKDGFYAHKVMWDAWVDPEAYATHIVGHWNYPEGTVKPVYVISTCDSIELQVNGRSLGIGKQDYRFVHTFDSVRFEPGLLVALGYDADGKLQTETQLKTAGAPAALRMKLLNDHPIYASGSDLALVEIEIVDRDGQRCPLANDTVTFSLDGQMEWRGGVAQGHDNFALAKSLPVECGVNRVILRSTDIAGLTRLTASASGFEPQTIEITTYPIEVSYGLTRFDPSAALRSRLDRGPTPKGPSYVDSKIDVRIASATAGSNNDNVSASWDDNELSEWRNDGKLSSAWITYKLERRAPVDDICIKLTGWRNRSYPLEIYAGDSLVWSGNTDRSLGYVHLKIDKPINTDTYTVRLKGSASEDDAFGQITEVAQATAGDLDAVNSAKGMKKSHDLRIVEIEFLESL